MDKNDKQFDELLDNALTDYSNVEPRAGLEGRILANLATAEPENKSWFRWWQLIGFASVAVIALVIFFAIPRANQKPEVAAGPAREITPMRPAEPAPEPSISRPLQAANVIRRPRSITVMKHEQSDIQVAEIKQAVFPAPAPLSDQERLILGYLRRTDIQEVAANSKPDEIAPLELIQSSIQQKSTNGSPNSNMR